MAVFVAGALHHDLIVAAPRLPRIDETLVGQGVHYAAGGKGANQAMAAARLGARVAMAGAVGSDPAAEVLLDALRQAGVETSQIARRPGTSGLSVALVAPSGAYGAVIVSAANLTFDGAGVVLPPETRAVLLQNEIPAAANLAVARKARAAGAMMILNAAPARADEAGLLPLTDILIVNRVEAMDLTGRPAPDAAAALQAQGPAHVIVTAGEEGLWLRSGTAGLHLPAHSVTVRSTHGAGDMFAGAIAAEIDRGADIRAAATFAQAAAALHVSRHGPDRAAFGRAEVLGLIAGGLGAPS